MTHSEVDGSRDILRRSLLSMLTVPPFPTKDNNRYPDARPVGLHDYRVKPHGTLTEV